METYLAFDFEISSDSQEVLMARLYDLGFESFIEEENSLQAFISSVEWKGSIVEDMHQLCMEFGLSYKMIEHNPKDWNAIWESSFKPIVIGEKLHIRAPFHKHDNQYPYELIIAPKMAFGTGHHATTAMILEWMISTPFDNKSVLDFGCGTGILGIFAKKKQAESLVMIDIEAQAIENANEHCELNDVQANAILEGSIEMIPDQSFDVIFANITRNVLEEVLPVLRLHSKPNVVMMISGFLKQDEEFMKSHLLKNKFIAIATLQKEDWIAILVHAV